MCRLFAVRSEVPVPVEPGFSALKRLAVEHRDGWGIARFDEPTPHLHVCTAPAFECPRFHEFTSVLKTRTMLAHIRRASVGAVKKANSHPFYARSLAFAHNGNVRHYRQHQREIEAEIAPEILQSLRGQTDSERCFGMMLTHLDGLGAPSPDDVVRALAKVTRLLAGLTARPRQRKPTSLNFLVTNGAWLVATRHHRTLFRASRPGTHFIASERLWEGDDWREVEQDTAVIIERDLSLRTARLADFS